VGIGSKSMSRPDPRRCGMSSTSSPVNTVGMAKRVLGAGA
jgi:hypothetical protein